MRNSKERKKNLTQNKANQKKFSMKMPQSETSGNKLQAVKEQHLPISLQHTKRLMHISGGNGQIYFHIVVILKQEFNEKAEDFFFKWFHQFPVQSRTPMYAYLPQLINRFNVQHREREKFDSVSRISHPKMILSSNDLKINQSSLDSLQDEIITSNRVTSLLE